MQFDWFLRSHPDFDKTADISRDEVLVTERLERDQHSNQIVVRQVNHLLLRALRSADRDQVARVAPCHKDVFARIGCHDTRDGLCAD